MKLIVDVLSCPGSIVSYVKNIADKIKMPYELVREREKDLYKHKSNDFNEEIITLNSYEQLKPYYALMKAGDLLITGDREFASESIHKVTAVIDPDGKVYTPESLELDQINDYLSQMEGQGSSDHQLSTRDKKRDENFRKTLYRFINNVALLE